MKIMKPSKIVLAVMALAMATASVEAGRGGGFGGFHSVGHGHSSGLHLGGPVHVHGYFKSSGTFVHSYNRALPGTAIHLPTATVMTFPKAIPHASLAFPKAIAIPRSTSFYPKALPVFRAGNSLSLSPYGIQRDANGRIYRSEAAKDEFMRQTGHPGGWPGHVIDHIVPLKRGGADAPSNMQWQTIEEGKAKDKWE